MYSAQETQDFLEKLFSEVWQPCDESKLDHYYWSALIGHYGQETFDLDSIKQRMKILRNTTKERQFIIEESYNSDNYIFFTMQQRWFSYDRNQLCQSAVTGIYRLKEDKIAEAWGMTEQKFNSYEDCSQSYVDNSGEFSSLLHDKREFTQRLVDHDITISCLSKRELECLFYFMQGYSAKEIAKTLSLSHRTIESHLDNVKQKFGCNSKIELRQVLFSDKL